MWATLLDRGITILLTGSVLAFVEFLIKRHDDKADKKNGIKATLDSIKSELDTLKNDILKKFKKSEKDGLRTQLLVLILLKPDEAQEILTIAERYFKDLQGDWYMTSIFNKWLIASGDDRPEWFDSKE